MNSFLSKSALVFSILLCLSLKGFSQSSIPDFELGALGNVNIYQGDLTQYALGDRKSPAYGGTVFLNKRLFGTLYFRGNLTAGSLRGDDSKYSAPNYIRNVNFNTPFIEVSGLLSQPVLTFDQSGRIQNTLYLMGGIGYAMFDHNVDYSGTRLQKYDKQMEQLRQDMSVTLPRSIPVTLLGMGVRRTVSQKIDITGEFLHRFTTTDYLDGVSNSGDRTKNDSYHSYSIGLIYKFGGNKKKSHYEFRTKGRGSFFCPAYI